MDHTSSHHVQSGVTLEVFLNAFAKGLAKRLEKLDWVTLCSCSVNLNYDTGRAMRV